MMNSVIYRCWENRIYKQFSSRRTDCWTRQNLVNERLAQFLGLIERRILLDARSTNRQGFHHEVLVCLLVWLVDIAVIALRNGKLHVILTASLVAVMGESVVAVVLHHLAIADIPDSGDSPAAPIVQQSGEGCAERSISLYGACGYFEQLIEARVLDLHWRIVVVTVIVVSAHIFLDVGVNVTVTSFQELVFFL